MKINNIINGWKNVIIKDEDIEELAKTRIQVCNNCPNKMKQLGLDVCGLCHCPLMAKVRSLDEVCPIKKW